MDLSHHEHLFHRPASPYIASRPSLYNQTREKERLELSTLNDKFADYVEKVRYLEAQNKKIQLETNFLQEKQQDNCQRVKSIFEAEMKQLKEIIEKTFKDKSTMLIAAKDAQVCLFRTRSFIFVCLRPEFSPDQQTTVESGLQRFRCVEIRRRKTRTTIIVDRR